MNTERTSSSALRPSATLRPQSTSRLSFSFSRLRVFFSWLAAAVVLAGLFATASQAGLKPMTHGGTGEVLALAAQLRSARLHAAAASGRTPGGRTLLPRRMMHSGALLKARAATAANVAPISGGVQTYDVNNPPPAFRPLVGYGSPTALNNDSTNPPVYVTALTPTNLYPVWSADETFLVFSSNRTQDGGVQPDGRFHLWAISVNGGEAFQITTSTGPTGGGEFFPALSRNNLTVAFTSDAASPGTQNLYALAFSYSTLSSGAVAATDLSATTANPTPPASLTLRASTESASAALTGFDQVYRPTFSPNDDQLIVFSAHSTAGTYAGSDHLYFLYTSSGGFSQGNNVSYPGKLTDGPANDTDPAYAPDGTYIAFASTANAAGFTRNSNNAFGPPTPSDPQDPNASQSLSSGAAATRSLFLISGGLSSTGVPFGTVPAMGTVNLSATGGRISQGSAGGFDDYGPAWSSFANQNQYTNPTGNFAYLAFARSTGVAVSHDIYYFQAATGVSQPSSETLVPETAAGGANAAVHLNTDDNAGETSAGGDVYDDTYPTWSPFLSLFSIAYMSNRTVTYNNPANGNPVEVAVSVPHGGTVVNAQDTAANYTVGANYYGLLVSQVLNLDPPTLLRFSADEVVHVQAGSNTDPVNGTPNKLAASGGQSVTLTVRLSDREAGIDNTGGPNGGPRVYVQIKDPDGKYQDAQNTEHKVFVKDRLYDNQPQYDAMGNFNGVGPQKNRPFSDATSGSADSYLGSEFPGYGSNGGTPLKYVYPSYPSPQNNTPVTYVSPRGSHGGHYFTPDGNNPNSTYIFVGKGAAGTTNTGILPGVNGAAPTTIPVLGTDPNQFIPQGPEYECQVVNPQFLTDAGSTGDTMPDTAGITTANPAGVIGDYVSPYWLAGVDDQGAFSGGVYGAGTDRPVANYDTTNPATTAGGTTTTTTHPAEWLQLTKVPVSASGTQDGDANGGVLYTVTWTTPASGSDFYVDVIAYDKAQFPKVPNSRYDGSRTNWRIYDNVGGFSTNQSIGGNDILLVSDYALGQKFAATTFGGRNLNLNLVPKIFGTESYLTDVDVNILPDSIYAGLPTSASSYYFNPAIQTLGDFPPSGLTLFDGYPVTAQNGLGVRSYIDPTIDDGTRIGGEPNVQSQRYSIWRILSRGPVPASLLQSYTPTPVSQPKIADAADPAYTNIPAASVLDAPRCVIWLSPYTGDVLADPGTLDDPGNVGATGVTNPRSSTTSILTQFVENGGRLFITGQDVGSTLTQGGSVGNAPSTVAGSPNFLPDVLNAELASTGSGDNVLAATANRITGSPFYDGTDAGTYGRYLTTSGPISGGYLYDHPNFAYQDNLVLGDADYGDSGLSQIPAITLPGGASVQGQPDVITATHGATTAITYANGGGALVYHDDPYLGGTAGLGTGVTAGQLPNGGTGSRVVYAGFGIEGLSNDYYASASPNPGQTPVPPNPLPPDEIIPYVSPRNPRPEILHNIVSFLRTGYVTGTITQTSGTGQGGGLGIDGVTVYLRPTGGAPSTRAAFSALTANGGRFTIAGVEPGTYTLVAIKPGFQRAVSNSNVSFTVEGDTTATGATLTMTPQQPGNIAGTVQDTAGKPINGATVTFTSQDNSVTKTAVTVNGSVTGSTTENYFIQNVPVTNYTATATGPTNPSGQAEYTPVTAPDAPYAAGVTVQPNTTVQPVNFTLTPVLAIIKGTITNSVTGADIAGANVAIANTATGQSYGSLPSGATGIYMLPNVPASAAPTATTYTITVTKPGFAPNTGTATVYLGSVVGLNIRLTPIPPGAIKATVTYSTGGPAAGVDVTYAPKGGTAQTVTTGTDGTVTISGLATGSYTVSAAGMPNANGKPTTTGGTAQTVTVLSSQTTPVAFSLTVIPPSFSGTVTSAATGLPLADAIISVTDSAGNPVATTPSPIKTAADGTYTTGPLAPGTYTLTVSLAGYGPKSFGPTAVQDGDVMTGVNFVLTKVPPGSIMGVVKDNHGLPVVGAVVTFNSTDGTVVGETATTDSGGNYLIPPTVSTTDVPASTYTGNAFGPDNGAGTPEYGSDPAAPKTVIVPSGMSADVNFTLPVILASVSGTVTDTQTGAVIPGATVTLTDPNGVAVGASQTTGAGGGYAFTGILATQTPSNYTVTASAPGYSAGSVTVVLTLGEALTQPIALNEKATLFGLVTDGSLDATGAALSGVTITVTNSVGVVVATVPTPITTQTGPVTGTDGAPENYLANLLPGTYTVTASEASYTSQSKTITLNNTVPGRVNFALVSSIGTLGGLVTNQNSTALASGATVTAVLTGQTTGVTFVTSGSSTTGPDGNALNYTGQLSAGTYTVTVTEGSRTSTPQKVTILGGTFKRLDFSGANGLPALHTFPAGIQFVSTPYDYSSLGFNGLFGTLNTAATGTTPNGNRSHVAVWNPLSDAYALDPNPPANALLPGVGYWVYLKNATPVTQQGATPTGTTVNSVTYVAVSLGQGWNQIGVPSATAIPISSLMFAGGPSGLITFQQASSTQYNLVTNPLYGYSGGTSYQTLNSASGVLNPWQGYWIYLNAAATIEIPTQ